MNAPRSVKEIVSAWLKVLGCSVLVGVIALLTNLTTIEQQSGQQQTFLAARFTLSRIANAGVVWAGISVLAGWFVRRPLQAAAAGVIAGQLALVSHYLLGQVLSAPTSVVHGNEAWFVIAAIFGAPLGLVGALVHHRGRWGLLAGLVVPVGAVAEPFVRGFFTMPAIMPWPDRLSATITGAVLVIGGLVLASVLVRRHATLTPAPVPQELP